MNPDRATLNFFNSFSESSREEGVRLHDDGAVSQIFGDHLFIQGRVETAGGTCRTKLRLQGNEWTGECDCTVGRDCPSLYATMHERLARGGDVPEAPNEVGTQSLTEMIEERLERSLDEREDGFVAKLEARFRRFELEREIFDTDLVRLSPRWEVESYDALVLWPKPPTDIIQFWNYIAYAFRKKNVDYPEFLNAITDFEWTEKQLLSWERDREVSEWRHTVQKASSDDAASETSSSTKVTGVAFRLQISGREARLLWREGDAEKFSRLEVGDDFEAAKQRYHDGALRMEAADELIWTSVLESDEGEEEARLNLEKIASCRLLNRLFHQRELAGHIVTLDEAPVKRIEEPLRWVCRDDTMGSEDDFELQLVTSEDRDVPHVMRLLPGEEDLYLSDETIFPGPWSWLETTEIEPRYAIPRSVLVTEEGVAFLAQIGATVPEDLAGRITDTRLDVKFEMHLATNVGGGSSEQFLVKVVARDADGLREEVLGREGWEVTVKPPAKDDLIYRYDRSRLRQVPEALRRMALNFDANVGCFRTRVVRQFPEKFTEWIEALPEHFETELEGDLASLRAEPVEATVSFEVVDQEIDWFDLKVVVNVEGMDLSQKEIKALVAARGEFVRMDAGGWLRLHMNLDDSQKEAVSRIGLDPFDLSGETHRLHVLQLAEPLAKEVFDADAWEKISARANSLKLQVRPAVPAGLTVELRPYQVEGFHFLSYLSANRFGGILADDMGLGKTIQTLGWVLSLRAKAGDKLAPSLVVCPKSVLDVWAAEVKKAAPELRVEVLRQRQDLDMDRVNSEIDLLVINYSQLRSAAEEMQSVEWLAVILDEGQQIKNPDSKAAKAARMIRAQNRMVLTGTPIENRLLDVWSLMSFAMPGILGNRKYFRERFDKRKDPQAQTRLTARLRPFLLRRTKGEVALDLPPKTEEDVFCDFEGVQKQLYKEELDRIQKVLLGLENDDALRKNSFVILQGLMRLRQICCHPALIDPKHREEESAKLNALFYLLDQLKEEGHKVLVFSQFVTMLDIIRDRLEDEDRPYAYLTGQTKDRQKVIEDFQNSDDPTVFLLSLKAGGSGLNLTAASYVVLYDPWWNPAVENQAIDRTHRIGQESKVIAYRLLMRESIEEKIRILQQQKRAMMTGVLGEEGFARNLQREDLAFLFENDGDI